MNGSLDMAKFRELEKYEINALNECNDPAYREKLTAWARKKNGPLSPYDLKKLKDKIESHRLKMD